MRVKINDELELELRIPESYPPHLAIKDVDELHEIVIWDAQGALRLAYKLQSYAFKLQKAIDK